jgi:predicted ATPase
MATADIKEADDAIDEHTKPPFLRRVRIRGYKSIAFCDVTLEPLTVLVGRNGAGKSNFLDALAFLRDIVKFDLNEAVQRHGGMGAIPSHLSDEPTVSIETESDYFIANDMVPFHASYRVIIEFPNGRPPQISYEFLKIEQDQWWIGYTRSGRSAKCVASDDDPQELTWLIEGRLFLEVYTASPVAEFINHLETIATYNLHPDAIRRLQKPLPGNFLKRDGLNLASVIRGLQGVEPVALNRVKQYVCHVVEEVSDFWVHAYDEYETVRFRMRSKADGKPLEFNAERMSDGTLCVLGNVMAVFQNVPPYGRPSVVGIEQPETALHPRAMNALVDALDEATLRTQVLVTTHSAELLDNPTIQPKNVRVVEMVDGQTIIAPVDAANVEIVQRNLNTLGGLERDNRLEADLDDRERQELLQKNGQEPH